ITYITKEVRSEVFTEYLAIKRTNFNTIASFFNRYTLLYKRIKNTKFKIDNNFELTFLYNIIKAAYPIDAKYWVIVLEVNELNIGSFLAKLGNISNIKSRTSININI
ncbi:hypothetical protein QR685DRAFT_434027, partial [Neurospora intermedia]